jgi:hypothetical protein
MKSLKWSFLAGFLLMMIAFGVVSWAILDMLSEPVPGWLSDSGAP